MDLPTLRERKEIMRVHISKRLTDPEISGEFELTDETLDLLSSKCEGFVGAEIEQMVIDALFEAYAENSAVRLDHFERAIVNTVPLSVTLAEQIRGIRDWANIRAVTATPREDRKEYTDEGLAVPPGAILSNMGEYDDVRLKRNNFV